jgi:hydroxypyruvate isomerase
VHHRLRYAVNCSILFTELPLLERPAAARAAGFSTIELWWPWPEPVPPPQEVEALVTAVRDAGVRLLALNLYGGDLAGADSGLLSVPGRTAELMANLEVVVGLVQALGISFCNSLYGRREPGRAAEQDELAVRNLRRVAAALAPVGGTALLEPLSGRDGYPLRSTGDAVAVLQRVAAHNCGVLCDLYHLARLGADPEPDLLRDLPWIRHVQIADHPGRGEPGSGHLDLEGKLCALQDAGYDGHVALEYQPTTSTLESLAWLPRERRA